MPTEHTTVLVVDDNDLVRKLLSSALQQAGFQVLEASSGYSAMAIADGYPALTHHFCYPTRPVAS
jgi:CheY-like chemotaxis protein